MFCRLSDFSILVLFVCLHACLETEKERHDIILHLTSMVSVSSQPDTTTFPTLQNPQGLCWTFCSLKQKKIYITPRALLGGWDVVESALNILWAVFLPQSPYWLSAHCMCVLQDSTQL